MADQNENVKVDVYRNLRTGGFSIRHKGRVIAREKTIVLTDVKFVVSQASRQRVLNQKKRNVHAILRGTLVSTGAMIPYESFDGEGYYNPYKHDSFIDKDSGVKLEGANMVLLHDNTFHYKLNNN